MPPTPSARDDSVSNAPSLVAELERFEGDAPMKGDDLKRSCCSICKRFREVRKTGTQRRVALVFRRRGGATAGIDGPRANNAKVRSKAR